MVLLGYTFGLPKPKSSQNQRTFFRDVVFVCLEEGLGLFTGSHKPTSVLRLSALSTSQSGRLRLINFVNHSNWMGEVRFFNQQVFCPVPRVTGTSVLLSSLRWRWMKLVVLFNKMVARRQWRQLSLFLPNIPLNLGKTMARPENSWGVTTSICI